MTTLTMSFSSPAHPTWGDTPAMSTTAESLDFKQDSEVANKVLRRAQVSKMTRQLQNRLALANVKVKNGWTQLSIESIEPRIEETLRRKRRNSSNGPISDTSSRLSDRSYPPSVLSLDSPLGVMFSDDVARSGSIGGHNKRFKSTQVKPKPARASNTRRSFRSNQVKAASWKSSYQLPESSPVYRRQAQLPNTHMPSLSFVSATTVADDQDGISLSSEDDDIDLPLHSFQVSEPHFHSSPPRTPPSMTRAARQQLNKQFQTGVAPGQGNMNQREEGAADLLMFLATSPSPANPTPSRQHNRTPNGFVPPSTPPAKHTPLPSSMMNTPGGTSANYLGFGAATPGMNFHFSDYLNVTPSPAQAAWRTPGGLVKTPLAAREARRRINFDGIGPGASPSIGQSKPQGLGMELGGELVSSQ